MLLMTVIRSSLWDSLRSALQKPCMLETVEGNLPKMCVCNTDRASEYKGCFVFTCKTEDSCVRVLRTLGEVWVKSAGTLLCWLKLNHRKCVSVWARAQDVLWTETWTCPVPASFRPNNWTCLQLKLTLEPDPRLRRHFCCFFFKMICFNS